MSRILKKETGRNFEETVAYVRAECSIRYLLESDMTITDISYECGFSAPRYYNAAFKKFCGCTPAEYRKKIKSSIRYSDDVSADSLVIQEGVDRDEPVSYTHLDVYKRQALAICRQNGQRSSEAV